MEGPEIKFLILTLGFNRPKSLERLLDSVQKLEPADLSADLLVSLDGGGDPECVEVAQRVDWKYGDFQVAVQPERMGLQKHILSATDRVGDYDAIVVLEDDLTVSPWALHFCKQAYDEFADDGRIAQISLYASALNEFTNMPFRPVDYGFDNWFCRVPSSWGQMYTKKQWRAYREWLESGKPDVDENAYPSVINYWEHSWKTDFSRYISSQGLYVVCPRVSLSTNHGDPGQNYNNDEKDIEVPLDLIKRSYRFAHTGDTDALYDEWFEPLPQTFNHPVLQGHEFEVDLYGVKKLPHIKPDYLLSSKKCSHPIYSFSMELVPFEMNVRLDREGSGQHVISFGKKEDFQQEGWAHAYLSRTIPRGYKIIRWNEGLTLGRNQIRGGVRYRIGNALLFPLSLCRALVSKLRAKP